MFLEQAVRQYLTAPVVCLDLCAAPGGKSTHLQSILPANSLLVSNEVIRSRSFVLKENLIKWGSPYSVVTCNDPKDIGQLTHLFDVIVADLPCSGEGLFRKDKNSRKEWSTDNVRMCAARQRRIIRDVWDSLKPGGLLVYSTCTFNREENEENIRHIIEQYDVEVLPVSTGECWNIGSAIHESFPLYRFYPHRIKGEGFCLALLRKREDEKIQGSSSKFNTRLPIFNFQFSIFNAQLFARDADTFHFEIRQNSIQAIPVSYRDTFLILSRHLRILYGGISVGEIRGKDILPASALAFSTYFQIEAFPSVELTREESIRYLQRESLVLPEEIPTGLVVVKYNHIPLGFVKNIRIRANNLYPHEWRIRKK
jgi:NOL1/NOP2/fmu family ribosome biogenesis protein